MATTETAPAAPPRRPSAQATLGAAARGTLAASHATVTPTILATGVASRAVAEATERVVGALAAFSRTRQATIIPLLQRQLTETFVERTPVEIAKLLTREAAREKRFQQRQASRMRRDLPRILAEHDATARGVKLEKLLKRERRYLGQRERAMMARAHSVVESLYTEEESPQGAYWRLGHAINHTPGCIAMSGKFWPWSVLREVGIPPIHPGCACELVTLEAATKSGYVLPETLPTVKDAMHRARAYMALEEALLEVVLDDDELELLVAERLVEVQDRYPEGVARGGQFMPHYGRDYSKSLLQKLIPGFRGRGEDRKVWISGHHVTVPHDHAWNRKVGGALWSSPPGGTNVYRNEELVAPEGEHPTHPEMAMPTNQPPAPLGLPSPTPPPEVKGAESELDEQLKAQVKVSIVARKSPVMVGQSAAAIHRALLANGFEMSQSDSTKKVLRWTYDHPNGHRLKLEAGKKSGAVEDIRWTPAALGVTGQKPITAYGPVYGKDGNQVFNFAADSKPWKPLPPLKPVPPTILPALRTEAAAPSAIPNLDHIAITIKAHTDEATDEAGNDYLFHTGEPDHVASELLANAIYRKLGVPVEAAGLRHISEPDFASIPDVPLGEKPIESDGHRISTGIIIRDPSGNVTIFEPLNHYGGYEHSFPKGGVEPGLTPQQNAHKELWEETGLHAEITGVIGDYKGDTGISRFYTGVLTGGVPTAGNETEAVKTVPPTEAATMLNKERDKEVLADLLKKFPDPPATHKGPDPFPKTVQVPSVLIEPSDSKSGQIKTPSEAIGQHYMADALLGNWDVLGPSGYNIRYLKDGTPVRTSTGGSLGYREDGREKPFGPVPSEVWSLRDPRGAHFGRSVTSEASRHAEAADIVKKLTPEDIDDLASRAPFRSNEAREHARVMLKERLAWFDRYAKGEEHEPEMLHGKAAAAELTAGQVDLELFPEQHAALSLFATFEPTFEAHFGANKAQSTLKGDAGEVSKQMDSLLRYVRTDDDVISYIGLDPKLVGKNPIGKTLNAKSYLTATLAEGEARKQPGVLQLIIPRGSHAIYTRGIEGVDPADVDAGTPDIIAQRGSRVRIISTSVREGKTYFEAVLLR